MTSIVKQESNHSCKVWGVTCMILALKRRYVPPQTNFDFISERELMFMFAICRRPSVCRLSVVCRL